MESVLKLNNISKSYGSVKAVNNLCFEIKKGNIYGILGPNGSGKSTTLGIILNVVNKTSGSYSWFNKIISSHEKLKKVGAIIEHPNFYPYMSAYQNLKLVCKIKGVSIIAIENVLTKVGLLKHKDRLFKNFSLGMKQRLAIASALLNDPEILILDEPTNGLDPQGIHQIREIITTIAKSGTTILLASHLLDEVEKICTHVLVLSKGKKLYSGKVTEMVSSLGFFEMKSNQHEELVDFIKSHPKIKSFNDHNKLIKVYINENVDPEKLIKELFDKKIILTHFIKRKESLEEQFLKLTKKK